jgi:hypothetical protein
MVVLYGSQAARVSHMMIFPDQHLAKSSVNPKEIHGKHHRMLKQRSLSHHEIIHIPHEISQILGPGWPFLACKSSATYSAAGPCPKPHSNSNSAGRFLAWLDSAPTTMTMLKMM